MSSTVFNEYQCAEFCLAELASIGANMYGCCNFYKAYGFNDRKADYYNFKYEVSDADKREVTACYFSTADMTRATLIEKADINNQANIYLPIDGDTFNVDKKYEWQTSFDGLIEVSGGYFNKYGVIETLCTYRNKMSAALSYGVAIALASLSIA